jgi:hypothetical protein
MVVAIATGFYDPGDGTIRYVTPGMIVAGDDPAAVACPSCFIACED